MNNKKIKSSIERAINEAPAISFYQIADLPYRKMTEHDSITAQPEKKVFNLIKQQLVLAISFCLVAAILVSNWYVRNKVTDSVIMLDVNPSIQILMNQKNEVISVSALNEDAKFLTEEIDFKQLDLDDTINAILNALADHNYLNQGKRTILLSVENKDIKKADELVIAVNRQIILSTINQGFSPRVLKQIISKDKSISELAKKYNISVGKMTLIQKLVSLNSELSPDRLVSLPMEDLILLAKEYSIDLHSIVDYDDDQDNEDLDSDGYDINEDEEDSNIQNLEKEDSDTDEDEDEDDDSQGNDDKKHQNNDSQGVKNKNQQNNNDQGNGIKNQQNNNDQGNANKNHQNNNSQGDDNDDDNDDDEDNDYQGKDKYKGSLSKKYDKQDHDDDDEDDQGNDNDDQGDDDDQGNNDGRKKQDKNKVIRKNNDDTVISKDGNKKSYSYQNDDDDNHNNNYGKDDEDGNDQGRNKSKYYGDQGQNRNEGNNNDQGDNDDQD